VGSILKGPLQIVMHEWEGKELPEELANDMEFLRRLTNLSDTKGERIFDVVLKRDGRIAIKARGYVGVFTLRDSKGRDVVLVVEPKIGVRNLRWMLALTEARNFKELREIENLIFIPNGREDIIDLLVIGVVRKYVEKLSEALTYGFVEQPSIKLEESAVIRGRIVSSLIPRTLFGSASPRVAYEELYYTIDNPINQYILDAGYVLYLKASYILDIAGVNSTVIFKALLDLDYTPSFRTESISIREFLSEAPLDRAYIRELLRLVTIIRKWLEFKKLPYPGEFEIIPALYINMNNLFESFVRKVLLIIAGQLRRVKGVNIVVKKAGKQEKALVVSPRTGVYLEPDIVIEVNGRPVAVGDVKYKLVKNPLKSGSKGDRDSVNQVYTYIHGWDVDKGFLIYPSIENETTYETYTLKNEKKLYIVRVCVEEVAETFRELREFIRELLRSSKTFNKLTEFLSELTEEHN